jgi:hypothetical protein
VAGNDEVRASATALIGGLTPGPCTFTTQYKLVGAGSATFKDRDIIVIPA